MKYTKRLLAIMLTLCMFFSSVPLTAYAENGAQEVPSTEESVSESTGETIAEEETKETESTSISNSEDDIQLSAETDTSASGTTVVIAGSDFQNPNGNDKGAETVTNILTQIQNAGYTAADGFLFCGDYDYSTVGNESKTVAGLNALIGAVKGVYNSLPDTDMIMAQGNHDAAGATGLATSGAHDSTNYGVYVINEDDYMWNNSDEATIKATADSLNAYLNAKIQAGYSKPVFVVSHLPLHYSMRTKNDGDGKFANYIFDVLNAAGAAGLNIVFLYGHDHSNGWDDYLGGSAVYLAKGDKINIAQASKYSFEEKTLNFTYMNAGFTGYYENHNGADDTLTMTVFNITNDSVQVERYDSDGKHNLKSAGVTNSYKNESGYSPDTNVYQSPQNIDMETIKPWSTITDSNVEVSSLDITSLNVTKNNSVSYDQTQYSAYASYDITPVGYTQGNAAIVTITLDAADGFDTSRNVMVIDKTGQNDAVRTGITDGKVIFTTNHFSTYDIAQAALDGNGEREYTRVTAVNQLADGSQYLLIYNSKSTMSNKFMLPSVVTKANNSGSERTGFDVEDTDIAGPDSITGDYSAKEWTFTNDGTGWKIGTASGNIKFTNLSNQIKATLETEGDTFSIKGSENQFIFNKYKTELYLNYNSRGLINGYKEEENAAPFYIYKYTGTSGGGTEVKSIVSVTIDKDNGSIRQGASLYVKTGSILTVTYTDGTSEQVPVTLEMISGEFKKNVPGTYSNLTITYENHTISGYSLTVVPKVQNDYPEYPHEGAVRVNKTGEGIDFQSSGIAKVELSATGVPVKKGADVIIMLDTSSSMGFEVDGKIRIDVLKASLTNLLNQFQAIGEDGEPQDIRVAIADFNGYSTIAPDDDYVGGATTTNDTNQAGVFTGINAGKRLKESKEVADYAYTRDQLFNADAFVSANDIDIEETVNYIQKKSGTNYDEAFDNIYRLGSAIKEKNEADGEERDLFVIFMSDGAPFQYNQYQSQAAHGDWNKWLQGTYTGSLPGVHTYFYNGDGNKHRMAEAIKGDVDTEYEVIVNDSTAYVNDKQYLEMVSGLGATMYSIGFCLEEDTNGGKNTQDPITVASMEHVLKNISSNPDNYYYSVNSASELNDAFKSIGNEIAYAATNARFVDTMGANYDLQMKSSTYTLSDGTTTKTITPEIIVQAYDIYTKADGVAESEIGKRTGSSTVLEKVTFKTDGTEAYSDKKTGNILTDGVICANTFWYNTTANTVSIDTNGDGTNDYELAPETFYWKMGTINQTDLALSYYVYLTGSMEGQREAGSYPTNESATLHYTNWLGNEAKKDTVSPVLAWESANVSYAFYLVDDNGNIIVNKSTGQTGSFANKVAVTNPVVYSEVLLNSGANVQADILASEVLPEGYTLFDAKAAYNVTINSNSTGSWSITKGTDAATTYVTEYGGNPTTILSTSDNSYDYTHTVVWFAVKYVVKAIPDAVVIDYGLPVDIHVLKNDMFYDKGELKYIGAEKTNGNVNGDQNAAFTGTKYKGDYGDAELILNTSVPEDSVVRYTPANMQMNSVDKFSYAVDYSGDVNSGYYYGTVTVIPATTVYYEDNFVTYKNATNADNESKLGVWTVDGTEDSSAVQDEDRPGTSSLSSIDANNVYGHDSAYENCTQFSLGSAHKVTVDAATGAKSTAPEATFTFTGTGFDIISLTDSDSGTIFVTVYKDGTVVKKTSVDNYYGYKYGEITDENGNTTKGWYVDKESNDTIWQVPVIKIEDLEYGTYTVTIQVAYSSILDHREDGSYSFWLDAIRIYDPAQNDAIAQSAYEQDKEAAPQYITLRDLLVESQEALNVTNQTTGVVFIDGKDSTSVISDYANPGPNHETYLAYGQGVSFKLSAEKKPASVQLGVKLAFGDSATLKWGEKDFQTVITASDMYYRMDGLNWTLNDETNMYETDVIILSNATEDGVISITNLKYTYAESNGTSENTAVMSAFIDEETVNEGAMLMCALYSLPVEEPEAVFEPEYIDAKWKAGRVNKKSELTVTTSEDVNSITVNGTEVTEYKRTKIKGSETTGYHRVWKYKEKIKKAGSYYYDVVVYDENGTASEPIETVLTVSK